MSEICQKELKRPLVSLRFPSFKSIEEFLEQMASDKIQSEKRGGCERQGFVTQVTMLRSFAIVYTFNST